MSNPWPVFKDRNVIAKEPGALDFMGKGTDLEEVTKKIRQALMKG